MVRLHGGWLAGDHGFDRSLRAEGRVVTIGRRVAFAEARLVNEAGTLFASATSTLLIMEQ
ncbi:MAG TPA: hypothetical protein VGE08_09335 [Steroidobacter sp.]|uniref:PaaI family thioesterase n=1 Tax=Steroidobacter sp. TaxID=1978227 RepID=UPI002ED7DF13